MRAGIYEAYKVAGYDEEEGTATAAQLKDVESTLIIAGSARKFRVSYVPNLSSEPWRVSENQPVGTLTACDNWELLETFTSFREARAYALRLARGGK
jgi:hypothetical protein